MGFIHTDFIDAAKRFPDHLAVWSQSGSLTYRELDEQSSALAAWLREQGVRPGERVGMMLPRTANAIVSIFGILKSGVAYVPLDPSWPDSRIGKILRDCQLKVIIAPAQLKAIPEMADRILYDGSSEWHTAVSTKTPYSDDGYEKLSLEDLAYILYTSGSTGDPKGVCISHRAAHYFACWARTEFHLSEHDRIAAISPFAFDMSTFDLFSGLGSGAGVYLVDEKTKLLPSQVSLFLERHRATVIYAVPSRLGLLVSRGLLHKRQLNSLRLVLFAGEVFPPTQLRRLMEFLPDHVEYYNLYGPTETNVCAWYKVPDPFITDAALPIGKPLPGTEIFAKPAEICDKDEHGKEICVAGSGVMSGYWGRDDTDFWTVIPGREGQKAYRTGDLGELRDDGNWIFNGRMDGQVKFLGYRVELGEVESCLLGFAGISEAAVVKVASESLGERLVAFIVAEKTDDSLRKILEHCRSYLPSFMVPARFWAVEAMPLTYNGKIDRQKLAELAEHALLQPSVSGSLMSVSNF